MEKSTITFLILLITLIASHAWANTVIDTYPSYDGGQTNGYNYVAQTFTAPVDNTLLNYQFEIAPRNSNGTLEFSIYNWAGNTQAGPALYSVNLPWTSAGGTELLSSINLPLTTGNQYVAVINLLGYSNTSVYYDHINTYSGGNGLWSYDGTIWTNYPQLSTEFRAEFGSSATPTPIPAAAWLMVSGLMGLIGLRRRMKVKNWCIV